jgi:ABC-type Fe3+/spermidine/putrescine transport system ATPase subunit
MSAVRCENLTKVFPEGGGLRDFSCMIGNGEFFAVLGPSGCGKTTFLRIVAGLETPDEGHVFFDDRDMAGVLPEKRDAVMVFQNYALFPHMNVFENVAFGLRARKKPRKEIAAGVRDALELVQLQDMETRNVTELSGGQQQRIALARALAVGPKVLLMDEPLSNLDVELRHATREQLAALHKRLRFTAVYVTHDQEEALDLADRVAVLKDGVCQQVGTPAELLKSPATPFVESFLARQRAGK